MPTTVVVYFNKEIYDKEIWKFTNVTCIKKNINGEAKPISSIDELINYKGLLIITATGEDGASNTIVDLSFVNRLSFNH